MALVRFIKVHKMTSRHPSPQPGILNKPLGMLSPLGAFTPSDDWTTQPADAQCGAIQEEPWGVLRYSLVFTAGVEGRACQVRWLA